MGLGGLYDYEVNRQNHSLLLQEYDPRTFTAFLGAGLSAALAELPDNEGLYKMLRKEYGCADEVDGAWPDRFSHLYKHCSDRAKFDRRILEIMKPPRNARATTAHIQIAKTFTRFVTTNYYEPVEDAFAERQEGLQEEGGTPNGPARLAVYHILPEQQTQPPEFSITYLHGHSAMGFCLIAREDFQYFYPSLYGPCRGIYVLENLLAKIFCGCQVVFFGCSLEQDMRSFLSYLKAKIAREKAEASPDLSVDGKAVEDVRAHYWITDSADLERSISELKAKKALNNELNECKRRYFEDLSKINVRPILCDNGFIFIEDLCKSLRRSADLRSKLPSVQEVNDGKNLSGS